MNSTALCANQTNNLTPLETDLEPLPTKLTKRLWTSPMQFVEMTHALAMAEWALSISQRIRPTLPVPVRRGPKKVTG